jgi:hypothetical protein
VGSSNYKDLWEIMQYKAVLVYFKHYVGRTENMAGINNMNRDGSEE